MYRYWKYGIIILLTAWFAGSMHMQPPAAYNIGTAYIYPSSEAAHSSRHSSGNLRSAQPKEIKYKLNKFRRWLKEADPYIFGGLACFFLAHIALLTRLVFFIPEHPFTAPALRLNSLRGPPMFCS